MLTPHQFKQRWERVDGDNLASFLPQSLSDVLMAPNAKAFLVEVGLPEEAAPCLSFEPPANAPLPRVSVVWQRPAEFDRFRIIGSNGSGDPICVDEKADGQVVYLNHDSHFERVLMASSVIALAHCLVEFRDEIADAGGDVELISASRIEDLIARLRSIDSVAGGEDGYWQQELRGLQPQGGKQWWQFWKQ